MHFGSFGFMNIFKILACGIIGMSVHSSALAISQAPLKILCIGDSVTQGGNRSEEYTYRLPLYRLLKQKGYNVDFIGTRKYGLNEKFHWPDDFPPGHEGFYGATTDAVRQILKQDLPGIPAPDIAIIDLGGNDEDKDAAKTVIPPLKDIIAQLRARNPKVKILIVQIPGVYVYIRMHFRVWLMAHELNEEMSPVVTIPIYFGWDTQGDTFDGAHPNIKGQNKMAAAIFSELEPLLSR
jgi:acyl-CoA thioesterase I